MPFRTSSLDELSKKSFVVQLDQAVLINARQRPPQDCCHQMLPKWYAWGSTLHHFSTIPFSRILPICWWVVHKMLSGTSPLRFHLIYESIVWKMISKGFLKQKGAAWMTLDWDSTTTSPRLTSFMPNVLHRSQILRRLILYGPVCLSGQHCVYDSAGGRPHEACNARTTKHCPHAQNDQSVS